MCGFCVYEIANVSQSPSNAKYCRYNYVLLLEIGYRSILQLCREKQKKLENYNTISDLCAKENFVTVTLAMPMAKKKLNWCLEGDILISKGKYTIEHHGNLSKNSIKRIEIAYSSSHWNSLCN